MDHGLNMEKLGGSLTKWPGRRVTGGFQPLDRDLASNLGRRFPIRRRRCVGGVGGGGVLARGGARR